MFGYFVFLAFFISFRFLLVYHIHEKYLADIKKEDREKFKILISNILRDKKKLNNICDELQICEWRLKSWAKKAPPRIVMAQVYDWIRQK